MIGSFHACCIYNAAPLWHDKFSTKIYFFYTVGLISENAMFASKKQRYFSVLNDRSFDFITCDGRWIGFW